MSSAEPNILNTVGWACLVNMLKSQQADCINSKVFSWLSNLCHQLSQHKDFGVNVFAFLQQSCSWTILSLRFDQVLRWKEKEFCLGIQQKSKICFFPFFLDFDYMVELPKPCHNHFFKFLPCWTPQTWTFETIVIYHTERNLTHMQVHSSSMRLVTRVTYNSIILNDSCWWSLSLKWDSLAR